MLLLITPVSPSVCKIGDMSILFFLTSGYPQFKFLRPPKHSGSFFSDMRAIGSKITSILNLR